MPDPRNSPIKITLSVVSHGQGQLLGPLFGDLERLCAHRIEVILTHNVPEELPFDCERMRFPVRRIHNLRRKGFGENHNAAFTSGSGEYFCVLNPDIRLHENPFPALVTALEDSRVGVAAPLILDPQGTPQDSARMFPTPLSILRKLMRRGVRPDYPVGDTTFFPDWIAGMFMLFRSNVFQKIGGFNERYFLYYEDVDLCARLRLAGLRAALCPSASAVHAAQRASHRDLRHFRWHVTSMLRFFCSRPFRSVVSQRFRGNGLR